MFGHSFIISPSPFTQSWKDYIYRGKKKPEYLGQNNKLRYGY